MSAGEQPPAPPEPPPPQPEDFPEQGPNALGSFGQRAGARVLDELLISVPFSIVVYVLAGEGEAELSGAVLVAFAVAIAVQAAYEIGCVALWGRTLGKLVFGLRVARYTDGGPPTWSQAALRALLPLAADVAAVALVAVSALGAALVYASAFLSPLRRGWHDSAGGTLVVRTR